MENVMNEWIDTFFSRGHYADTILSFANCILLFLNLHLYRKDVLEQKLPYLFLEKVSLGADTILQDKDDPTKNDMNFHLRINIGNSTEYLAKEVVIKACVTIKNRKYKINLGTKTYLVSKGLTISINVDKLIAITIFNAIKFEREHYLENDIQNNNTIFPKLTIQLYYKSIKGKCVKHIIEYTMKNCSMIYNQEYIIDGIDHVKDLYECKKFDYLGVVCRDVEEQCNLIDKSEYNKFLKSYLED